MQQRRTQTSDVVDVFQMLVHSPLHKAAIALEQSDDPIVSSARSRPTRSSASTANTHWLRAAAIAALRCAAIVFHRPCNTVAPAAAAALVVSSLEPPSATM